MGAVGPTAVTVREVKTNKTDTYGKLGLLGVLILLIGTTAIFVKKRIDSAQNSR